jgi:hypothetical protein
VLGCLDRPRSDCAGDYASATLKLRTGAAPSVSWRAKAPDLVDTFADPTESDPQRDYHLCVFDVSGPTPRALLTATAPSGGTCGTRPCWSPGTNAFRYRDKDRTPDGIARVAVGASERRGSRIRIDGRGDLLPIASSFADVDHVLVQLQRDACDQADLHTVVRSADGLRLDARP